MASLAQGPPVSPDVMAQQMPPMSGYGAQGQQMLSGAQGSDQSSADPNKFAMDQLNDIAAKLMNVAKVLGQTRKELMPLVQKMAEAGSMLTNELQANNPQQAQASPDNPPQAQSPGDVSLGQ